MLCHGKRGDSEIEKCNLRRREIGSVSNLDLSRSWPVALVFVGAEEL